MQPLKSKDYILIGILSAVYMVLYIAISMGLAVLGLGAFVHSISPGIFGLVGGTIVVFLGVKCPKRGVYTLMIGVVMALFSITQGAYLPWILTSMAGAILADVLCTVFGYKKMISVAAGYGLMQVGQCLGGIVPVWFFAQSYKETWIKRGMPPEVMDEMIRGVEGIMGFYAIVIVFLLAAAGVWIGRTILKKHFVHEL